MSGWFAVKRGITEHPAMKGSFARVGMFLWMIENAAWQDTQISINGRPYTVPRGALCFAERFMAGKFGISQKALRTFFADLEAHGVIKQSTATVGQGTKSKRKQITLCNYDRYQSAGSKTEAKRNQNGSKEEQLNNITSKEDAALPPSKPVEISVGASAVWNCKPFLASRGVENPGPIIGKWLKDYKPVEILSAFEAAQKSGTEDPIPYITAALRGNTSKEMTERDKRIARWERMGR